jgi:peptidoglycan/LPS O-acetylase OafA/YrhL
MSGVALPAAFVGVAFGAAFIYQLLKRQWWGAGGSFALASVVLPNLVVSHDNLSDGEFFVLLAVQAIALACFVVATVMNARTRRRRLSARGISGRKIM